MATQRLLRLPLRGVAPSRPADSLVQIISILGARRRALRASAGERLRPLLARATASEQHHLELENRLAGLEGHLARLERAQAQRDGLRRERIVRLRAQLEILRGPTHRVAGNARMHQLGSLLMYVGGLAVLWVVLLELGLALGLS